MALIAPFRGLRYNQEKCGSLQEVITPPYDVISSDAAAHFQENPFSMIHLDIKKDVTPEADEASRYQKPKEIFESWMEQGVLRRDHEPAIYLYDTEYQHPAGRRLVRRGFVALIGLAEWQEGIILPHEQTFESVIQDRLKLMEACRAQFSQIFALYSDPESQVLNALDAARSAASIASVTDHLGCRHTLSLVRDQGVFNYMSELFTDKTLYIADGHHRYTTALAMRKKMATAGPLPASSPYNFTMMYLSPMEDPGLTTLPAHRLVENADAVSLATLLGSLSRDFDIREVFGGARETLVGEVLGVLEEGGSCLADAAHECNSLALYHPDSDRGFVLSMKPGVKKSAASLASLPEALQALDVVVLAELVVGEHLGLSAERCVAQGLVTYYSDTDEAVDAAVKKNALASGEGPILFLLRPTPPSQVRDVADAGCIMPHKSTYFYPKIVTGLVMNQLISTEKVANNSR